MNSTQELKQKNQKLLSLQKKYEQRITIARQARESYFNKDYLTAVKKYTAYLSILAEANEIDDIFKLSPTMFDPKSQLTEMLLISHVYWELAKIYDLTPKTQSTFQKSLSQFVKFSINQPYQVLNSEMIRKYIKKTKTTTEHVTALQQALSQIHVQSQKCFIATECFGTNHYVTKQLRVFKNELIQWPFGIKFVGYYYKYSNELIIAKNDNRLFATYFILFSKTPLRLFASLTKTAIFNRCSYYLKLLQKNGLNH